jgi:hypothetical protein
MKKEKRFYVIEVDLADGEAKVDAIVTAIDAEHALRVYYDKHTDLADMQVSFEDFEQNIGNEYNYSVQEIKS